MDMSENVRRARPAAIDEQEWQLRLQLAACYRLFDWLGWSEMIYNHITVRVPGPHHHYLINPFGLWYNEVTAHNLLLIDLEGNKLRDSPYPVNAAGLVIHSAVHRSREDAHCIMHTHTTAGMAVACKQDGLRHENFYSAQLQGEVAYHDFEGVTTNFDEQPRLVASLGAKSVLILRNHGLLVAGPTIPHAFSVHWTLQRACEVQALADSMGGANSLVPRAVLDAIPEQNRFFYKGKARGQDMFDAVLRKAGIRYEDLV